MYVAHRSDDKAQTVLLHLLEAGELCAAFAKKIRMENTGLLLGSKHDFGKYSSAFQNYINSSHGLINPDADEYNVKRGSVDHSTAGAQLVYQALEKNKILRNAGELAGQIIALCIACHHSGLIDINDADFTSQAPNLFKKRMATEEKRSHLEECKKNQDDELKQRILPLLDENIVNPILAELSNMLKSIIKNLPDKKDINSISFHFQLGFLTRFLFSCLIDADRINSAEFAQSKRLKIGSVKPNWSIAISRLEAHLEKIPTKNPNLDAIRQQISEQCKNKASQPQGIYSLTVPTGGGKTLASLRYALHHAKQHQMDHIFFITPFTSIIEQNAEVIRNILEEDDELGNWVLEHHSNLEPSLQTWESKIRSENWDAPIVVTTMVQFLQVLFEGGTRSVRRLHHLANSVLIFDEIQTLPTNCIYLFCNALNFLVNQAQSTAILCTATQPLLNRLPQPEKGQLQIKEDLIDDVGNLFDNLKRVQVENKCKKEGWEKQEIVDFSIEKFIEHGTCLVVVNTKQWAQDLYFACQNHVEPDALFHLSTHQCVMHRKYQLKKMRARLAANLPVLCFSTQLIEAGVDVDFPCAIRFLAGLDSVAQTAGRCNRNGLLPLGMVYIINPAKEHIDSLENIKIGKAVTGRVLDRVPEGKFKDVLEPDAIECFFGFYFHNPKQADKLNYQCKDSQGNITTLLKLLSTNDAHAEKRNQSRMKENNFPLLEQSFGSAGRAFKVIDAPIHSVIVPYVAKHESKDNAKSKQIIITLCESKYKDQAYFEALKEAQLYSVNVFPNVWKKLCEQGAVKETPKGSGIYHLDERYYHDDFGLSTEIVGFFSDCSV